MICSVWMRSTVVAVAVIAVGCDPAGSDDAESEGEGDGGRGDSWIAMGQGEFSYSEVSDGDELLMVLGGQGLLMFPMPIRGAGFPLPDNPYDYTDPHMPTLDMHLDIEGFNIGFGGHFARIANYPVPFEELDNGTYEFIYVTIFVPDELANPCDIDEQPGELHVEVSTGDGQLLTWDASVTIEVPAELGEGCTS